MSDQESVIGNQEISREGTRKSEIEIRALSLLQPWASLLVFDEKKIETRSWKTSYRGPVAIHASQNKYFMHHILAKEFYYEWMHPYVHQFIYKIKKNNFNGKIPYGKIIGIGKLIDCIPVEDIRGFLKPKEIVLGDYSDGRWAWKFEEMRPIKPIEISGKLGLWWVSLPEEVVNGQP